MTEPEALRRADTKSIEEMLEELGNGHDEEEGETEEES